MSSKLSVYSKTAAMVVDSATMSTPKKLCYDDEDALTHECKELLSTLPRERGWISEHIYKYQGFWACPWHLQGRVACQKHFQAHDTDAILITYPKSGTTWLKAMAFALSNRSRFSDLNHHPLLATNPHDLVPFLEIRLFNRPELPDLSAFTSSRLFATHVPVGSLPRSAKDTSCKLVYLFRNPKDTLVSFWHFTNKMRPAGRGPNSLEYVFERFCDGTSGYSPFWDHVLGYWKESLNNPRKILFLKYEEILEQPGVHMKRLADFLECPFSPEEEVEGVVDEILRLCSFDHLSNLEVNKVGKLSSGEDNNVYFRKGEVGGWINILTPKMAKRIDQITEQKMHGFEFEF